MCNLFDFLKQQFTQKEALFGHNIFTYIHVVLNPTAVIFFCATQKVE